MSKKLIILFIFIAIVTSSCGNSSSYKPVEKEGFFMGTIITEEVYGENARKAADDVMTRMKQIQDKMTINAPGSEVDNLNSLAGKESVTLSADTIDVIATAQKYAALSEGAFDVTVGPLVKAWGIFTDHPRVPPQNEINTLLSLVNYKDLSVDVKNNTAKLAKPAQIVDLGGIGKGYGGDEAIAIYKKYGIKSAYVNLGGNVVTLGGKPDGSPWRVGIQNPRAPNGQYIGIITVKNKSVVTSGDYERYFMKDNVRYHHIIDTKTGYPAESGLISATIVTDVSINADALSTATFVLGLDKGTKLVESLKGVDAIFITKDKKVYVTPGLKDIFTFDDESKEYEYVEKR